MSLQVKSVENFFQNQGLDPQKRVDQDLIEPGVQNDRIDLDQFSADYWNLSPEDRFQVFTHLRNTQETELLKHLLDFKSQSIPKRFGDFEDYISEGLESAKNHFSNDQLSAAERRADYAEMIYRLDYILSQGALNLISSTDDEVYHDYYSLVRGEVALEVYRISKLAGFENIDSDEDGVVDPEDIYPLDSRYAYDSDRDGVSDKLDVDPDDLLQNFPLEVGEKAVLEGFEIHRLSETEFSIGINVKFVYPDEDILPHIRDEKLAALFKRRVEKTFEKVINHEDGRYQFNVNLNFQFVRSDRLNNISDSDLLIKVSKRARDHSRNWSPQTFSEEPTMTAVHELMHHLDWEDFYNEPIVDNDVRNRSLHPKYVLSHGYYHIMNICHHPESKISEVEFINQIASLISSRSENKIFDDVGEMLVRKSKLLGLTEEIKSEEEELRDLLDQSEERLSKEKNPVKRDAIKLDQLISQVILDKEADVEEELFKICEKYINSENVFYELSSLLKIYELDDVWNDLSSKLLSKYPDEQFVVILRFHYLESTKSSDSHDFIKEKYELALKNVENNVYLVREYFYYLSKSNPLQAREILFHAIEKNNFELSLLSSVYASSFTKQTTDEEYEAQLSNLARLLSHEPNAFEHYIWEFIAMGKISHAKKLIDYLLTLNPYNAEMLSYRGMVLLELGDYRGALASLARVSDLFILHQDRNLDTDLFETHFGVKNIHRMIVKMKNFDKFETAVDLHGDDFSGQHEDFFDEIIDRGNFVEVFPDL